MLDLGTPPKIPLNPSNPAQQPQTTQWGGGCSISWPTTLEDFYFTRDQAGSRDPRPPKSQRQHPTVPEDSVVTRTLDHLSQKNREERESKESITYPTKTNVVINIYTYNHPKSRYLNPSIRTQSITERAMTSPEPCYPTTASPKHPTQLKYQKNTLKMLL